MAIPTDIAGLQAWFKADAGTSTTTDGVGISQWDDQSGNANHATQATGANQPLYKVGILNSLPVVRFDGSNDSLSCAASAALKPVSLFAVVQPTDFTAGRPIFIPPGSNFGFVQISPSGAGTAATFEYNIWFYER